MISAQLAAQLLLAREELMAAVSAANGLLRRAPNGDAKQLIDLKLACFMAMNELTRAVEIAQAGEPEVDRAPR